MYISQQGRIRDFGNGVPSVFIQAISWGIYPRIPNSHTRKTPKHTKMHQIYPPPPPQICGFPRALSLD